MTIFSCFLPKAGCREVKLQHQASQLSEGLKKPGAHQVQTVNERYMELLQALSLLEGGGLPVLSDACRATLDHLEAEQVCVCLLGADQSATVVACAGVDGELSLGRRLRTGLVDTKLQPSSTVSAVQQVLEASPAIPIVFQDATAADAGSVGGRPHGKGPLPPPLPEEWQQLYQEHKCQQFAAAAMLASGVLIGVFTLAAKGPSRPSCWTPEVIQSIATILAGHLRSQRQQGGAALLADSLAQLHAAAALSTVVEALGEAAVEVSAAVAHVRGQARVAFLQPDGSAAAIFQQQHQPADSAASGLASPMVPWSRRASCEYVMSPAGSRRTLCSRISMDAAAMAAVAAGRHSALAHANGSGIDEARPKSITDISTRSRGKPRISFTMPSDKGASCKGHTLQLAGTLLLEALSKEAAGLCIADCPSYIQDKRAIPRDTVLSRDAVMPMSLALATISQNGQPLLALYITYSCTLPQPLLQAVVHELQQLLQAITPMVKAKIAGDLKPEWDYLCSQLETLVRRKQMGDLVNGNSAINVMGAGGGGAETSDGDDTTAASLEGGGQLATFMAGNGLGPARTNSSPPGSDETSNTATPTTNNGVNGANGSFSFQEPSLANGATGRCASLTSIATANATAAGNALTSDRNEGSAASPFTAAAAAGSAGGPGSRLPSAVQMRRKSLLGPSHSEGPTAPGFNSALRRLLGVGASDGHDQGANGGGEREYDTEDGDVVRVDSIPASAPSASTVSLDKSRAAPNRRIVDAVRSVSFRLEAARTPRGASKLAPIITIMHERLKAAQAAQMTGSRSEARKADLQSLKLLQEIGQGGYGTVYRGTYHGSEVAIKVIQEKELANLQTMSGDDLRGAHNASVLLHKQHLHDAIELVASVSVSHPNIVQVLTFFTDCRLQLPETSGLFDSMDVPDHTAQQAAAGGFTGARLVHMPSLLESPAPGQDITGGISVALVMEYMDAGSLSDAIQNRVFFERLDPGPNAAGRGGKGLLAVSMRAVYATLLEVALALRHMHALHLVHCDLKPQNVLLKTAPRDPRGFTAKLSDFGLAKTMAHDEEGQLVIDEAVASGTITHIAPEVFIGKKSLGAAVDIYAFGIIMYQVLCGMRLYEGMSAQEIANSVAHRMLRPVLPQWVPANYRGLAERCWHPMPSVRPTADELVRQLEKLSDFRRRNPRPQSGFQH